MKTRRKKIGGILCIWILLLYLTPQAQCLQKLDADYYILQGEQLTLQVAPSLSLESENLSVATLTDLGQSVSEKEAEDENDCFTLQGTQAGESTLTLSLFGKIPVKTVQVHVLPKENLLPGGSVIGISMYTDGLYIVDVTKVADEKGDARSPAKEAGIQKGDVLLTIDGQRLSDTQDITSFMKDNAGEPVELCVRRGDVTQSVLLSPAPYEKGGYKLGLWVRDSTAGVGTVTYVNPKDSTYGALGHAITDTDNGDLLPVQSGDLYPSTVVGIHKGVRGTPGELQGLFLSADGIIGSVEANTQQGIFGHFYKAYTNALYPYGLPVGLKEQLQVGEATILSTLDEKGIQAYSCRIVKIANQDLPSARNLILEITDKALLDKTGGIVQGMSGSPIIQNGMLVGAVTHVFVNDPTKGYGIFIENMLDAAP